MSEHLDPGHILETGSAFFALEVLLSAVALDLFSLLGERGSRVQMMSGQHRDVSHVTTTRNT